MNGEKMLTDEEALRNLLTDDCLQQLESQISGFNLFDVLKIARAEIRHSNVLAWLLDPKESHGLGDRFLKELMAWAAKERIADSEKAFRILLADYSDAAVYREWRNIDLLVVSESDPQKIVLCIENKVDSDDHDKQLPRYQSDVEGRYDDYDKIFLYLTPDGREPLEEETDAWECVSYKTIGEIIQRISISAPKDTKEFIEDYLEILRREIMENDQIAKICRKIYGDHRQALDLIFENRPDRLQNLSELLQRWAQEKDAGGEIFYDPKHSNKSYTRFRTKYMDDLMLPSSGISGWGTKHHYFYEIASYVDKGSGVLRYRMSLTFNSKELEAENREQIREIYFVLKKKPLPEKWEWKTVFSTKSESIPNGDVFEDLPEKEIRDALDKMLKEVLKKQAIIENHFKEKKSLIEG